MPTMFSKKRASSASRSSAHRAPLDQSTTSSAAMAASQAFLQRPPSSSGSLSSAAAAAALRSHTSSPEPVGSIQTKRMLRRGSLSSVGSGTMLGRTGSFVGRPGLQRRDSSGSMTERTFRSPSPGRVNGAASPDPNAPPVPAIPKNILIPHQRSSSLEPPARAMLPNQAGRAMSLDRNSLPPQPHVRPFKRLSDVNEEAEQLDSNRSVNFSRPRTSQPSSPVSPTAGGQFTHGPGNWFSEPNVAPTRSQQKNSATALEQKIARIQAASGQPVHNKYSTSSSQAARLSHSNHRAVAAAAPEVELETYSVYDPNSRTFITKLRPKPRVIEPPSPPLPQPTVPAPGTYDPNTRRIVPYQEPSRSASPIDQVASVNSQQRLERPPVITAIQPPPRNPARLSPVPISPVAHEFHNPPSTVQEKELIVQPDFAGPGRVSTTSAGPAKAYVAADQKQRSNSLDVPHGSFDAISRGRGGSASPSPHRAARFSNTPVTPVTIHDPPSRNLSPAKPALKHSSPASSIRTNSPMANIPSVPRSPVSEASDTTSQTSQEAFSGKRKKSVRVSFDEQPHAIEASTAASTPTAINSSILDDIEDEELMKPRPALPSFGSVRNQRAPPLAEKVTEMAPERYDTSNDHAIGGILRNATNNVQSPHDQVPPEVTSKDAAGYVSDESDQIVPPIAASAPAETAHAADNTVRSNPDEPKVRDFAPVPEAVSTGDTLEVPAINLLPPTPGVEDEGHVLGSDLAPAHKSRTSAEINLPGGWNQAEGQHAETASRSAAIAAAASEAGDDSFIGVPEEPVIYSSPASQSPLLEAIDEDSDTDSAEFSDAAEDLSELDNGGFASLNAIAVSPVIKPPPADQSNAVTAEPPESPSVQQKAKRGSKTIPTDAKGTGDWSEATTYWSQLSRQQREQIEREHLSSDDDEAHPSSAALRKARKKMVTKPVVSDSNATTARPSSFNNPAPASRSTMKTTMRGQPAPRSVDGESHMRQTMRTGEGERTSATLRNRPPPKQQPVSERKGGFAKGTMRAGSQVTSAQDSRAPGTQPQPRSKPPPAPVMTARLQKELANDSDSESSFKKKRRSSASKDANGKYSMKRSMRGGPSQDSAPPREERPVSPTPGRGKGRDSFSIRSLSPTGSLFGRKKRGDDVRTSLRASSVDGGPRMTLRSGPPARDSARLSRTSQSAPKFKSRFVDSDDDDEDDRPKRGLFRSRFADSDDDDDDGFIAADLTPVRGIPRRQGQNDGDSTDLEDEDSGDIGRMGRQRESVSKPIVPDPADIDKAMEAARKKLGMNDRPQQDSNQGTSLSRGSLRASNPGQKSKADDPEVTPEKKRRGIMGSILRRNRGNSTASIPQVSSPLRSQHDAPASPIIAAEPARSSMRPQSPVSPQGKLIRRTSAQARPPQVQRGDSNYSSLTAPPAMGETHLGGDWPLPAVPKVPENYAGRPNTSDGSPVKTGKEGSVRFEDPQGGSNGVYSQRTGKKKKFGMLRRAFKLDD